MVVGDAVLGAGSVKQLDHLLAIPAAQTDVEVEDHVRSLVLGDVEDEMLQAAAATLPLRAMRPAS